MKIFIAFVSIIWLILVIITVTINVLDCNFSNGEGIAGAIGSVFGGILICIPSYFGIKYSYGGQSSERKTATNLNRQDNIPINSVASKPVVNISKTFQEKKDILIDLKADGILSEMEFKEKTDLILKQEDSIKDQINTEQIQNLVIERIEPYLNKLSDLTKAKILTEDEFDQKKAELIEIYTKKISAELSPERLSKSNIYENEKLDLILRFKKLRKKWSLNSNDIREIHSLIEQFILIDDSYLKNIKSFQAKYGFDLVAEVRSISNSYAFSENILAPLIQAGIVDKKYPYEIKDLRSELYPENSSIINKFDKIDKSNLTGAEITGVKQIEYTLPKCHFLLKSKITNNITSYSKSDLHNIIENGDMANYFLIV